MLKIAINGFGRIGRNTFKAAWQKRDGIEIVAINDLTDNRTLAHLLKYDTAYPEFPHQVGYDEEHIIVDGKKIRASSEKDPANLPWKELEVDVAVESTGVFRKEEDARKHLQAGAKKVVLSAPGKGENIKTFVRGVNCESYNNEEIIDNASCTTNCTAPVMRVMENKFGVEKAQMTTIHAYTAGQNLQDGPHKDLRRARAACQNIVPTTTGAAKATAQVVPELKDKFNGISIRVPIITVSLTDFVILTKRDVTAEEVNDAMREAAGTYLKDILTVTEEPLVSTDFIGNPYSSIIDAEFTGVVGGNLVKILSWYDNEWAYALRLVEMVEIVGGK